MPFATSLIEPLESRIAPAAIITVSNVSVVESDEGGTSQLSFEVKLSESPVSAVRLEYSAISGTAQAGRDFSNNSGALNWTLGTADLVKTVNVSVVGDFLKEGMETMQLQLTNLTGVASFDGGGVQLAATGTINDGADSLEIIDKRTLQWMDSDGDLVTLQINKSILNELVLGTRFVFADDGLDPGRIQLQRVQLAGVLNETGGILKINAEAANGGDGEVDVGLVESGGLTLKLIQIGGDLGKITGGSIGKLVVDSLGLRGTATQIPSVAADLASSIAGSLGSLKIQGEGIVNASLNVEGRIGSVFIAGDIIGGSAANSGSISFIKRIDSLVVEGGIFGGAGANSGSIAPEGSGKIGKLSIGSNAALEALVGGSGAGSGSVSAGKVGAILIDGHIVGGSGVRSGVLDFSEAQKLTVTGNIVGGDALLLVRGELDKNPATSDVITVSSASESGLVYLGSVQGAVRIDGFLIGGNAVDSGKLVVDGAFQKISVGGIIGGGGTNSGNLLVIGNGGKVVVGNGGEAAMLGGIGATSGAVILSKVNKLIVEGDVVGGSGTNSGSVAFKQIGKVQMQGDIVGGAGARSGVIASNGGKLGEVNIEGDIVGGSGQLSGALGGKKMKDVFVAGDLLGGSGVQSGFLDIATSAGNISIGGAVIGGSGAASGRVLVQEKVGAISVNGDLRGGGGESSGRFDLFGGADRISVGDDLEGGSGIDSGVINLGGVTKNLSITGDIAGGTGSGSGGVGSNFAINKLRIGGGILGGDNASATQALNLSGFIVAGRLIDAEVTGAVVAGTTAGGALTNSGAIRAINDIVDLRVGGMTGTASVQAVISAGGQANLAGDAKTDLAIKKLTITGTATHGEILAGYDFSNDFGVRGRAFNADASIGTVIFEGAASAVSVIAGVEAGTDGFFGSADDYRTRIDGGEDQNVQDRASLISQIASVVFAGDVTGDAINDARTFGIVAQQVVEVVINGVAVNLLQGSMNDTFPGVVLAASPSSATSDLKDFHAFEIV